MNYFKVELTIRSEDEMIGIEEIIDKLYDLDEKFTEDDETLTRIDVQNVIVEEC